jgi:PKD repeat protein
VALAAGTACDKVPLMAPTETTITLFANTTTLPVNGTAEITATVIESAGTPVQNGTVVIFFTSLGTIEPVEARTHNGKATVRLNAGSQSGTATVRASSGANTTKDPLTIAVGGAAAGRIEVFASPSSVPSGGGTSALSAIVYDTGGNRLPNVQVSFAADNGSVSPNTALTNGNGEASATLITTGAAKVTATVAGASDKTISATVDVKVRSAPDVSITVGTTTPTEGQPVSFTFSVKPGTSGAAVRSAVADFGDGGTQSLGVNGNTTASHTYRNSGSYTVTATATDAAGETTVVTASVVVRNQPALDVTIQISPAAPVADTVVTFTATAAGVTSGSTVDRYEWNFGDGNSRTTTSRTTTNVYGRAGRYTVSVRVVTSDGASGSAAVDLIVTGVSVTLGANDLSPGVGDIVKFTATVTPSGTSIVRYEWNFGDGVQRTTTANTTEHTYSAAGNKTVTVRAFTVDGGVAEAKIVLEVS